MRTGRFFPIPESPRDVRRLWERADPLGPADRTTPRCVGTISTRRLGPDDLAQLDEESECLVRAGLIVEPDPVVPNQRRVLVSRAARERAWAIGIYQGHDLTELVPGGPNNPVITAETVTDIPAAFVADPFLVPAADRWWIFFEVMNWRTWRGEIGLAESRDGRDWHYRRVVLTEPFHLSYPYVFAADGQHWMIPETHQTRSVRLYRASEFPYRWEFHRELIAGQPFADASLARHAGQWWMFVECTAHRHDTLRLYHATHFLGPWQEHARSPIVRDDPSAARPAGRAVPTERGLIRLAQDCRVDYGTAVYAFIITNLSIEDYVERPLCTGPILGPSGSGWNASGMHHLDATRRDGGWLAAVDGWCWE